MMFWVMAAQPGSVRATADHRVEERVLQFGGNARAVVDDLDARHQAMTDMADGELAQRAGAQGQAAQAQLVLPGEGLHGVAHDIEHGLIICSRSIRTSGMLGS